MLPRLELLAAIMMIATTTWTSAAATPKEHTVIILGSSYFPSNTVVETGDVVRFVNASGHEHVVTGEQNAWTTGVLPAGTEVLLSVEPHMFGMFFGKAAGSGRGSFSASPPLPPN